MSHPLYEFVADLSYPDIPIEARERVKLSILDSLCTAVAGSSLGDGAAAVLRAGREAGGAGSMPAAGFGVGLSPLGAALVNGATSHALNFDMVGPFGAHLGVVTFAAPSAAAELRGKVSGEEYIAAVTAGAELMSRMAAAARDAASGVGGVHPRLLEGQLLGYFGAAAASAAVLGLDADGVHDAIGLALMQAAGTMEVVLGGDVPAKAAYGGFANHGGLLAASLARAGLRANMDVFGGKAGVYPYYYGGSLTDNSALVNGLGTEYRLLESRFKLWPTSGLLHPFIEAVVQWRAGSPAAEIARVTVRGPEWLRPWATPQEARRRPANGAAASNSLQYALAKAFTAGTVRLSDLTPTGIADPVARELADRIDFDEVDDAGDGVEEIAVRLADGTERLLRPAKPRGSPGQPLPTGDVEDKFLDALRQGAVPVDSDTAQRVIATVRSLEDLADVRDLWRLLPGGAA
ncbi:MAG: hypothetical protein GEV12_01450 [Micromonosporaceae bacterium]|nr:hypothetical protein [Micromonosporaceae bacterium]